MTTTGSALAEVVGNAALTVPADDADAFAGAIESVLEDPAIEARLRGAGPVRAAQFTWSQCVEQHVDAYQRAAKAGVQT